MWDSVPAEEQKTMKQNQSSKRNNQNSVVRGRRRANVGNHDGGNHAGAPPEIHASGLFDPEAPAPAAVRIRMSASPSSWSSNAGEKPGGRGLRPAAITADGMRTKDVCP
mmetsp:Transcript_20671/g.64296  ORF Transcript_20671/g.64296 Transcript_20671/m.64296 type:complete len:109 (-) Transcript_20671:175-501(-)